MAGSTKKITKVTLEHMDWKQVDVNLRETQDYLSKMIPDYLSKTYII